MKPLQVALVALLICAAIGGQPIPECNQEAYSNFINNNQRIFRIISLADRTIVNLIDWVDQLTFPLVPVSNNVCAFTSADYNGYTVGMLDVCTKNITKSFSNAEFDKSCATLSYPDSFSKTIFTSAQTVSIPIFVQFDLNNQPRYITTTTSDTSSLTVPTSVAGSVNGYIDCPATMIAAVGGQCTNQPGNNVYCQLWAQMYAPYYISAVNPIPVKIPNDVTSASVLVTDIDVEVHDVSSINMLLSAIPKTPCKCNSQFQILVNVSCVPGDEDCDYDLLSKYKTLIAYVDVTTPACTDHSDTITASMGVTLLDSSSGKQISTAEVGEKIDIVATVVTNEDDVTQWDNIVCDYNVTLKDFSGITRGTYVSIQEDQEWEPDIVEDTPLVEKLRVVIPNSLHDIAVDGLTMKIDVRCEFPRYNVNNNVIIDAKASSTPPTGASGFFVFTLGPQTNNNNNSDNDNNNDNNNVPAWAFVMIGIAAVAVVATVGMAAYILYKRHKITYSQVP